MGSACWVGNGSRSGPKATSAVLAYGPSHTRSSLVPWCRADDRRLRCSRPLHTSSGDSHRFSTFKVWASDVRGRKAPQSGERAETGSITRRAVDTDATSPNSDAWPASAAKWAPPTVGEHRRQVAEHPAGIMRRRALPRALQRVARPGRETDPIRRQRQQRRPARDDNTPNRPP